MDTVKKIKHIDMPESCISWALYFGDQGSPLSQEVTLNLKSEGCQLTLCTSWTRTRSLHFILNIGEATRGF